jgi:uncharacterized membrane protein YagU involved in acid resistance
MLAGAAAGFAATAPMTAAMIVMHRLLPWHQRYPLPPRKVTMNVLDTVQVKHKLDGPQRTAATLAAHFGYGTAMGAIYAAFADKVPLPRAASGIGWGLAVWAGSYLGLLPALDLHEPATRHPRQRNGLMIAAHVVWGAALGLMIDATRSRSEDRTRKSAPIPRPAEATP